MTERDRQLIERSRANFRRVMRSTQAMGDSVRLAHHRLICAEGREWQFPDGVLSDDEIEAIEARCFGRTLAEIDELPVAR